MKKIAGICTGLVFSVPFGVAAQSIDFGNRFTFSNIDSFVSGIISNTNVETSSGGIVASGSAAVSGDSSASADVRTIINSGRGGTTYRTEIRTESDGVVRTETVEKTIPAGRRALIRIATSSYDADTEARAVVDNESGGAKAGFSSLFSWLFAPSISTSAPATDEGMRSDSDFFKAQEGFFSAFWEHTRTFFGFF